MAERTLIKGGAVLSLDPAIGNFNQADVLYEGSKILQVGRDLKAEGAKEVDASHMIVMPGFIDTHRHMWQGLLRNSGTAFIARNGDQTKISKRFRPTDVYASTLTSALAAIDAGFTTILDYSNIGLRAEHTQADLQALTKSGIRAVFATGQAESKQNSELVSLALASEGPEYMTIEELKRQWGQARELGLRITTQVGMGNLGNRQGIAQAAKAGLLGGDVLFAHCNTLTNDDLKLIHENDGHVSMAPAAEMMLGYGPATVQRMLDMNFEPSLGVDSEGASRGDHFTQMRSAISMQHAMSFEKKLAHRLSPDKITTRHVLDFATVAGAKALGMEDKIGTLTPGKQADILMLRQFQINVMPVNDPIGAVVWAMDTSNVDTVIIGGKTVKSNGELLNADLADLRKITSEARDHILAA